MASLFAESVLERLRKLGRGEPELLCDGYDEDNFGNATATIELDGLRLHVVNDRGIKTVEIGFQIDDTIVTSVHPALEGFVDGRGQPVCPLEVAAVVHGWITSEVLAAHYWPESGSQNYEESSPPGPFLEFDKTLKLLEDHWDELSGSDGLSRSRELQWRAGEVENELQERFAEQLESKEGNPVKTYASKDDIYKDFDIAFKFGLERMVHTDDYENDLTTALSNECQALVKEFSRSVANYRTQPPTSAGFFVDVVVKGDTGQELGTRLILLEHETGPEFFISLATEVIAIIDAVRQVVSFMKNQWPEVIREGVKIDHVEIRTENKGVMRIPFSQFGMDQVECLIKEFPTITRLQDCNDKCFAGQLVEPSTPPDTKEPQSAD